MPQAKKLSHYRPGQALQAQARRISRQSAKEGGTVVSPRHRPPLLLGYIPGTHFRQKLSHRQGYSVAGRIKTIRNPTDPIGGVWRSASINCATAYNPTPPPQCHKKLQ